MNMKMKLIHFLWLIFFLTSSLYAQKGIVSSGGDNVSPAGSVSFSVGQIVFAPVSGETGHVYPGIQQPYPLDIVGIPELHRDYFLSLFPNPANNFLFLRVSTDEEIMQEQDFTARVFDVKGNLLITQRLWHVDNTISIRDLPEAVYFIQVWHANTFIQSISFSKSN